MVAGRDGWNTFQRLTRWLLLRLQMYLKNGRAWATTVELWLYIELLKQFLKQAESFHKIKKSS